VAALIQKELPELSEWFLWPMVAQEGGCTFVVQQVVRGHFNLLPGAADWCAALR